MPSGEPPIAAIGNTAQTATENLAISQRNREREKRERAETYYSRRASWTQSWSGNSAPLNEMFVALEEARSLRTPQRRNSSDTGRKTEAVQFLHSLSEVGVENERREEVYQGAKVGKYVVGRMIDKGSFSECFEGYDTASASKAPAVAMKVVKNDPGFTLTMEREIAIWRRLQHRSFLPLHEIIRLRDVTIIVSPLAHRGNLLKYLKVHGPMSAEQARPIFKTLCEGLRFMHRELRAVHHDIKLENILLDKDMQPYLCDFGLSEYCDDPSSWIGTGVYNTDDDNVLVKGSLWYLPPELIDCRHVSHRRSLSVCRSSGSADWMFEKTKVDVWAMGIVLYALMSATLPFTEDYLPSLQAAINNSQYESLAEEVEAPIWDLIQKLLSVDIGQRPNMDEVLVHPWLLDKPDCT